MTSLGSGAVEPWNDSEKAARDQLSNLHALLVLSMLMNERSRETDIVTLASTAVASFAHATFLGVLVSEGWLTASPPDQEVRSAVECALETSDSSGGELVLDGAGWQRGYALGDLNGVFGYFVVSADDEPNAQEQFLLRVLCQQTGVALSNARAHARQELQARQLVTMNANLTNTIAEREQSLAIHNRLTQVAAAGEGQQGIAQAVHELTGHPIAVEDRYGNLRAWSGPDRPEPYPKATTGARNALLARISAAGKPLREDGRLLAIASAGDDILGVLVLMDPRNTAGALEAIALEHGATVLAIELAWLRNLAQAELRLGRELVEELLVGAKEEHALTRAQGLGYDLQRPHRVVLVRVHDASIEHDAAYHGVRRAARDAGAGSLCGTMNDDVVLLSDRDQRWEEFHDRVSRELGGVACVVGVGGVCTHVSHYPASYREAQLALRMEVVVTAEQKAVQFSDLGVYRLLADVEHPTDIEGFVREWLGELIDYDTRRESSELVSTLSRYLECGGNYAATAAALALHRNTLKYRLQRIREISGRDLNDPDTRFNLQFATRAWQTLQALRDS
jgi:DNA-binding PucR family transcriptional regulator